MFLVLALKPKKKQKNPLTLHEDLTFPLLPDVQAVFYTFTGICSVQVAGLNHNPGVTFGPSYVVLNYCCLCF